MIYSHSKSEDLKVRDLMLESVEIAARTGNLDNAKEVGEASAILAERIKTKDYSREDCWVLMERSAFAGRHPTCTCGHHAAVNNGWKPTTQGV